jgi:hypothetical protein
MHVLCVTLTLCLVYIIIQLQSLRSEWRRDEQRRRHQLDAIALHLLELQPAARELFGYAGL